jgi:hypothetical protein
MDAAFSPRTAQGMAQWEGMVWGRAYNHINGLGLVPFPHQKEISKVHWADIQWYNTLRMY